MAYTDIDKPSDYFNTVLYTGTNANQSITGVGFQPDLVWLKSRNIAQESFVFDSVRGVYKWLATNDTKAETNTTTSLTSFDSDGFTFGSSSAGNANAYTYAGWSWLAGGTAVSNTDGTIASSVSVNTTAGFSIVSFNGGGSGSDNIGHGLGSTPKIVLIKDRDGATDWLWYTTAIDGSYDTLRLNTTGAKTDSVYTAPTSSVFYFPANTSNNYIAYCFAEKKGFSKFGSYTGNGSATDGTFVYTGFRPAFVLFKNANSAGTTWIIFDAMRNTYNYLDAQLRPNDTSAEIVGGASYSMDFVSNGFKVRSSDSNLNGSGNTLIYMAFAENPFVTSTGIPTTAR